MTISYKDMPAYHRTQSALERDLLKECGHLPTTHPAYLKAVGAPQEVIEQIEQKILREAQELATWSGSAAYVAQKLRDFASSFNVPVKA